MDERQWTVSGRGHLYYLEVDGKKLWDAFDIDALDLGSVHIVDLAILQECCRQISIKAQHELDRRANMEMNK